MDSILLDVRIPHGMVAAAVAACGVQSCNILTLTDLMKLSTAAGQGWLLQGWTDWLAGWVLITLIDS